MKYVDIYITANKKEAKKIAKELVKKKLAACVNIFPITSIYKWKGKIIEDKELALFVKTKYTLFKDVEKEVKRLCSYDVPCILLSEIKKGHKPYLKWLKKETK
ncbi:MAG: divalent-cation tolerance protein CutA [Nanoarchaeota archaeon]|nr:divalent-cation tolerance protein CutA [Nanoarchaeota archaeon]